MLENTFGKVIALVIYDSVFGGHSVNRGQKAVYTWVSTVKSRLYVRRRDNEAKIHIQPLLISSFHCGPAEFGFVTQLRR